MTGARVRAVVLATVVLSALPLAARAQEQPPAAPATGGLRVGVGVADATWRVGAGSGQYTDKAPGGFTDPFHHSVVQRPSYGVHSRLDYRALVIEGSDGNRVALVKSDSYLAQDLLTRRAAQILAEGDSGIGYDELILMATHNHSSPYRTTPAWGVWAFQDVMDLRAFEYHARQLAAAVEAAADDLRPARMGATTIEHRIYKGNIAGPAEADDGTPAGYPDDHADFGVTVMRFDDISGPEPEPLAVFVNHGQHPESLDAYDLITSDFLGPLQRMVDRDLGATLVFSQGDVGSAEGPYLRENPEILPDGVVRAWAHVGHAQTERGARYLADDIIGAWDAIGRGEGRVPFTTDVPVAAITRLVPGPVSHPYPSVSNCRTEPTAEGQPGAPVVGLPNCERPTDPLPTPDMWEQLRALGLPVPEHYDVPAVGAVEENARLKMQVVRIGDVVLASCACEPQMDLVLNLESRVDDVEGNIFVGFDWSTRPGAIDGIAPELVTRMQAQVLNDAAGWDAPANAVHANSEPADPAAIHGNFTHTELPASLGYAIPVLLGHTGDYNGYTVSYREYMARDHYRKALTSYGPHTADHINMSLMGLAGYLRGGPAPLPSVLDPIGLVDELRQMAIAGVIGQASSAAYDAWVAALPSDVGPAAVLEEPPSITRYDATTITWRGGSTALDNPAVVVERLVDGEWVRYADQSGEVQTMAELPGTAAGFVETWTGRHEWRWTATFEAFTAFPTAVVDGGQVPDGTYRFVVDGVIRDGGVDTPYHLESAPFDVGPWGGVSAGDARVESGSLSFTATSQYPRTYESPFRYIGDDGNPLLCKTCSFRPWASGAPVVEAVVTYTGLTGTRTAAATLTGDRWVVPAPALGEIATIAAGDLRDAFGETNAAPITLLET